jgi:predicted GNAT superfamily acetyltransferase
MEEITVRECTTIAEFDECVQLQRKVFSLPDLEISPRRHLIVSRQAGGWTLGAFAGGNIIGFVHHLIAIRGEDEITGYSHMMAVAPDFQNKGVGAQLKWAQRARSIAEGRRFIKWTWDPMQARNAHFNLNRLGVTAQSYAENFYGTDYVTSPAEKSESATGIDSDRLFASWDLHSARVIALAHGSNLVSHRNPDRTIGIPLDWTGLLKWDADVAKCEQLRVRSEFKQAFAEGLVCAGFDREQRVPRYLLYKA